MNFLASTKTILTPIPTSTPTTGAFRCPHLVPSTKKPNHATHLRQQQTRIKISAIDDNHESKISNQFPQSTSLKIIVIGFGNYGQVLTSAFIRQGHTVFAHSPTVYTSVANSLLANFFQLAHSPTDSVANSLLATFIQFAHSPTDYTSVADSLGATFFQDPHDLCEQLPDVIVLCTSTISEKVAALLSLPMQRLKRNTLFFYVVCARQPRTLLFQYLLPEYDVLFVHPVFEPENSKENWRSLVFAYEKLRIGKDKMSVKRMEVFLDIFEKEGCRMMDLSSAEDDN